MKRSIVRRARSFLEGALDWRQRREGKGWERIFGKGPRSTPHRTERSDVPTPACPARREVERLGSPNHQITDSSNHRISLNVTGPAPNERSKKPIKRPLFVADGIFVAVVKARSVVKRSIVRKGRTFLESASTGTTVGKDRLREGCL